MKERVKRAIHAVHLAYLSKANDLNLKIMSKSVYMNITLLAQGSAPVLALRISNYIPIGARRAIRRQVPNRCILTPRAET